VKWLPWALLAIALLVGKLIYDGRRRAEGAFAVRLAHNAVTIDSLKAEQRRVDSVFVSDTIRLWRTVTRTESLIDTILRVDTVPLTFRESVLVFIADSLVRQCRDVVTTCESRVAVRDSLIQSITWERDQWKRRAKPSFLTRTTTALQWAAVGYLIGVTR
jgi:hypothetical protein